MTSFKWVFKLNKKGVTLIEIVAVITIMAFLTAIIVPSVYAYLEKGNQTQRDNIARTIFLSAQKQLLEKKATKTLTSFASGGAVKVPEDKVKWSDASDPGDKADIVYISKPFDVSEGAIAEDNLVVKLLGDVITDKDILSHAITIEFNKKTGAVLSTFYSKAIKQGESLEYDGSNSNKDIGGNRPYSHREGRKQGYYGGTGMDSGEETNPIKISLYDGEQRAFKDLSNRLYKDLLYAEILMPKDKDREGDYKLQILDKDGQPIKDVDPISFEYSVNAKAPMELESAVTASGLNLLFRSNITDADQDRAYEKYIWVIDYINKDAYKYNKFSIKGKSGTPNLGPQEIKVSITQDPGTPIVSEETAHSYYSRETKASSGSIEYEVASIRHLYNVRYKPDGKFKQVKDINFEQREISNFLPIGYVYEDKNSGKENIKLDAFVGTYNALRNTNTQYEIQKLKIDNTNHSVDGVGLFGYVGTDKENEKALITGVSLTGASIRTSVDCDIGAIAGKLNNGTISQCNSFSNILVQGEDKKIKSINAGGLVGFIGLDGKLEQSYNGGYFKAVASKDPTEDDFGRISLSGRDYHKASIGGVVGENRGRIDSVYNNGRVQIQYVEIVLIDGSSKLKNDADSYTVFDMLPSSRMAYIGGIVGVNSGELSNSYNTNFVGKTKNGGKLTENCSSGGITGLSSPNPMKEVNLYYLPNGEVDAGETQKVDLSKVVLGDKFNGAARGYKGPYNGDTTAGKYPYLMLKNNIHKTPWEDIYFVKLVLDEDKDKDKDKIFGMREINGKFTA